MNTEKYKKLAKIYKALLDTYKKEVPNVEKITKAMVEHKIIANEDEIINDHIAFRTLGVPNLGIASLEKIFLHYGYTKRDYYSFEGKKLNAYWYAPPKPEFPRVFLSELRVSELSDVAKEVIYKYTSSVISDPIDTIDLNDVAAVNKFFVEPLWNLPTLKEYNTLLNESEYAAWTIYNRYYLNHYTISIHNLKGAYKSIEKFNEFIESLGITLNSSGGKIKVSKDGLLKQSSTMAELVLAKFSDTDKVMIPGSYVEFAERLPLPSSGNSEKISRREGFESANADKIFESTYIKK
ncbi:DUF1338 domain-containing protein [Cellulophaga omnivescoria]|uniref:DUF1338 domain-containing protein n=1 Tax=Cellulophaga omnivescoria TaxID=1888890 RepID=UPI0009876D13|nr:DUF1338 domain-containing protein [Cellulophaga omnivescoria]